MRSGRKRWVRAFAGRVSVLLAMLAAGLIGGAPARADTALVAAASSLRQVWPALLAQFDGEVRTSFGASGTLAQQIVHGAPFQLFLAADTDTVDWLLAHHPGLAASSGAGEQASAALPQVYARGELVLIVRQGLGLSGDTALDADAATLLRSAHVSRLALANPRHAPYGRAAEHWLADTGIASGDATAFVKIIGENAAQAVQFVLSGAADAALVPASLVQSEDVRSRVRIVPLADAGRWAVRHAMLLLPNAGDQARALHDYLLSDEAQRTLTAAGFRRR